MILNLAVNDAKNAPRGRARMKLDFGQKQWSIMDGQQPAWAGVGFSTKGAFEVRTSGVIWLWDQPPGQTKHNTVILWDAPTGSGDAAHAAGSARIFDPKDPAFKDGKINWTADTTPSPIRQKAVDFCRAALPPVGEFLTPGSSKMSRISCETRHSPNVEAEYNKGKHYTNCGAFPAYIAKLLGGKGLILHGLSAGMKSAAQKAGAWVEADGVNRPLPGDFYVLENPRGKFSHVGVVIDASGMSWRTADSGQNDGFAAGYRDRRYKEGSLTGEPTQGGGFGFLAGWVDIENKTLFPNW